MAAHDLMTASEAKAFVEESGTARDSYIGGLVTQVSRAIETAVGGPIINTTVTGEKHDGDGTTELWLRFKPVASVTSVSVDDSTVTDYEWYDTGRLYRTAGWPVGRKNISVTYSAGRGATPPEDLKLAALVLFHHIYKSYTINVGGELGAYQALKIHSLKGWPPDVQLLVSRYRKVGR